VDIGVEVPQQRSAEQIRIHIVGNSLERLSGDLGRE
jgi:hypothetical protein